ncbi:MAG: hypothetical protein ACOH15_04990 [Acetobacterium sp.]
MVKHISFSESRMSMTDIYKEACEILLNNGEEMSYDHDAIIEEVTHSKPGFEKRRKKLFENLHIERSIFFKEGYTNRYDIAELTGLLLATYLSEDKRSNGITKKFFKKEEMAKITLKEKQQFLLKVIERLEARHKEEEAYSLISPEIDKIKESYEDFKNYEEQLENKIEDIKVNITQRIDEKLQNVGASTGLNEYIFNSTINKIKEKDFSIDDLFNLTQTNEMNSVGLTEIFEKDNDGRMILNHSETKMQLTRDDRLMVINKFEEFLSDAMDNWSVYLEEFERSRHEEYHEQFNHQCDSPNEFEVLSFKLPREIISNNLETSPADTLSYLQQYSSIQETESGLIANIQLKTDILETTEAVSQKAMDEYYLMLYDFLINTETAVSAKRYDDIINFDKDGLNYAKYCELKQSKVRKTPPPPEEEQNYTKMIMLNDDVFYKPKETPEEMREAYFLFKKNVEEQQMYIDNLRYKEHIGDQEAHETLAKLVSEDLDALNRLDSLFETTHFGEYYVFSESLRSQCQDFIKTKVKFKKKLIEAMDRKDGSIDELSEAYQSIPTPQALLYAMGVYSMSITLPNYKKQLTYILSKKLNVRNVKKIKQRNPDKIKLINWRDVYVYNKNSLIFIPFELLLPNITIRKVSRKNLKKI